MALRPKVLWFGELGVAAQCWVEGLYSVLGVGIGDRFLQAKTGYWLGQTNGLKSRLLNCRARVGQLHQSRRFGGG